jgi:polar amino acid transport system permease protein
MWSWDAFFTYLTADTLREGAVTTIWLTVVTMALGLVLGLLLAVMRGTQVRPLRWFGNFYIWLFRGTPVLVQLIIIYTGLPQLGIKLSPIWCAIIGLSLNEAAYLSEVVRGGIMSVAKGQYEAARALGMSPVKVMRVVVLPQAFRIMIPPLGNSLNGMLKTTTLVSVISVEELLRRTQYAVQVDFRVLEGLVAAALYFLLMTSIWTLIQGRIESVLNKSHRAAPDQGEATDLKLESELEGVSR